MNDSQFLWCILVPRIVGVEEIFELDEEAQQQLLFESSFLSQLLQALLSAEKINVAAPGNVVRQLHVHHIVRCRHDLAWPAPVWGKQPAKPYTADELAVVITKLKSGLKEMSSFAWVLGPQ